MRALASVAVAVFVCAGGAARGEPGEQVVVVGGDAALRAALGAALAPSGLAVAEAADAPAPSVATALDDTRRLADARRATAAVWLVAAGDGTSMLLVYDRGVDR